MDHTHFSNLSFSCPQRLRMKFEQHWPGGFRGKAIWNYQHFFHTNVWAPYKCIQKQTWSCRKKVKCQCMTIILATLVDHLLQMIYAKIQPQAILVLENKIFKCFFPYKCIRKQTWPFCKKVKCQCMTIILATLVDPLSPMIYANIQPQSILGSREWFLKVFTIYGHGGHLGQRTVTILAILCSPYLRKLHMKCEQKWPRGSRGEVVWNSEHFSHTNA